MNFTLLPSSLKREFYQAINPIINWISAHHIRPNTITAFSLLFGLISAIFLAIGNFTGAFIFMLLTGFCDAIDGSVARNKGLQSKFGAVLDSIFDRINEGLIFLGLSFYFLFFHPKFHGFLNSLIFFVIFGALVCSYLISYIRAKAESLGIVCQNGILQRPERFILLLIGVILTALFNNDVFVLISVFAIFILGLVTVCQRIMHCYEPKKDS